MSTPPRMYALAGDHRPSSNKWCSCVVFRQGFGHAVYCARHALGIYDQESEADDHLENATGPTTNGIYGTTTSRNGSTTGTDSAVDGVGGCDVDAGSETQTGKGRSNGRPNGVPVAPTSTGNGEVVDGVREGGPCVARDDNVDDDSDDDGGVHGDEAFLLVLGDHLYRRGAGTTRACSSQLLYAFLEHGEAGKPAIGLKARGDERKKEIVGVFFALCQYCFPPCL